MEKKKFNPGLALIGLSETGPWISPSSLGSIPISLSLRSGVFVSSPQSLSLAFLRPVGFLLVRLFKIIAHFLNHLWATIEK